MELCANCIANFAPPPLCVQAQNNKPVIIALFL